MSQNSKKSALGIAIPILGALFLTKALWVGVEIYKLPKTGVEPQIGSNLKPLYYHYSLATKKDKPKAVHKGKSKTKAKPKPKPLKITKFILKGIYNSKEKKVIVVEYLGKTYALSLGEKIENYTFTDLGATYAIFKKDDKEYRLDLFKNDEKEDKKSSNNSPSKGISLPKSEKKEQKIENEGGTTYIPKNLFNKYRTNISAIRKNIGVGPNMVNGKLNGFKIRYVKRGSDFDKLGLKRGDIITEINGEPLNNFKVPLEFFNNLDSISSATLTVKRGNEIKELEYEVR